MEDHSAHVIEYQEWLDAKEWGNACKAMLDAEGRWEDNGCRLTDGWENDTACG